MSTILLLQIMSTILLLQIMSTILLFQITHGKKRIIVSIFTHYSSCTVNYMFHARMPNFALISAPRTLSRPVIQH